MGLFYLVTTRFSKNEPLAPFPCVDKATVMEVVDADLREGAVDIRIVSREEV